MEHFRVFERADEHGVGAVLGERFVGADQEVDREYEVVGHGAADGVAATGWFLARAQLPKRMICSG